MHETTTIPPETIRLFLAVQSGDESRWDELYRHFAARIRHRLVRRHGVRAGDDSALDDLIQEAMTHIVRHLDRFEYRSTAGFYAWIYRRVEWTVLDAWKRRSHGVFSDHELSASLIAGHGGSPSEVIGSAEEASALESAVRAALAALPDKSREVFILRQYEEMPYREIASLMGITETDAKVTNFRTLEKLRKPLERWLSSARERESGS